ncbi:MAG: topoisomerase C-terminal repeat-containing protein [Lachnospiraceae bacterium]|nr:topoisomerase C-terminal repeat-containing protein [Lachnospiraceae bacterium]
MGKSLIITEKPSVAREYAQVLKVSGNHKGYIENDKYVITWCVGHLVEMVYPEKYDEKYKKWKLEDLPFLPKEYKYDVIEAVNEQYTIVHGMLQREDIDVVYWAGDSGKEGQTIEENIRNFGGVRDGMKELRVWIDSQTEEEIMRGIREARPMSDYANLGKSGIMRSIEDYAMGINFSRVMSVRYGNLLNQAAGTKSYTAIAVGRVMTCVLGMVVIREREIRNFVETPFFRIVGRFTDAMIEGEWKAVEGSKYFESPLLYKENGFKKEEDAKALIDSCQGKEAVVEALEKGTSKKRAPLLFNLAELQAECAKRFKISPDETLQIAQDLYERKVATYPRTDARVLSTAVAKEITKNIAPLRDFTPVAPYVDRIMKEGRYRGIANTSYVDDAKVTDHYAIIPTGHVRELSGLSPLHQQVFELIVKRFLSIFYPPAEYETVKLTIKIDTEKFFVGTKVLKVPGFLEVAGKANTDEKADGEKSENEKAKEEADGKKLLVIANSLNKGDVISVDGFEIKEGKTSPPKRYTSGSMVLAMENAGQLIEDEELREQIKGSGIGTSATRAEIIKKLIRIGYLNLNKKTQVLTPERLGEMIFEVVNLTVPQLLNPKMSASWEKGLDGITRGTVELDQYRAKLEAFIREETVKMIELDLTKEIAGRISQFAGKDGRGIGAKRKIGVNCPVCGGDMETTPFGYGCSNYKKDGTGCKFAIGSIASKDLKEEEVKELLTTGKTQVLDGFVAKNRKKFRASLVMQKDEQGVPVIGFDFSANEPIVLEGVQCPACGGNLVQTGFGYACSNRNREQEDGCYFAIGKIADKELSKEQVRLLLNEKKTETIRGFKGKSGKKFDACLQLIQNEEDGKWNIQFDFENVEVKKVKDVKCPLCDGEIHYKSFGFGCSNYKVDDENSCKFAIGKMAGKALTEAQVKELLTNGRTGTIRGFKSKTGKKFDARVALNKQEDGQITGLKFDFDDLEPQKVKDVKCPLCGGDIVVTPFGFGCSNYKKDAEDSCRFIIGQIASVKLKEAQVKELLTTGKTDVIKGFVAKTGMKFDAPLKLTKEGQITFDFPEKPKPQETTLPCPKCQQMLKKSQWQYECDCGFRIFHTVAKVELSEEIMRELFETKKTKAKVTGFTSKAGNVFDACLKMEGDKIVFDFDNPGVEESKPWLTNEGEMQPLEQGEDSGQGMVQEEPVSVETEMASRHEQEVEIKSEQHDENILSDENVQEVQTGETQELPWN